MSRCRVLHVVQNLNYGGMERLLGEIVRLTDPRRFESHVLMLQYYGRFADGLERFASLHQCDPLPPWSMLWPGPLIRAIRRIAPDVVHSHSGVWYKTSLAARRAGVRRVIHTEHGVPQSGSRLARLILQRAASRTDVVVAVSAALAEALPQLIGVRAGAQGVAIRVVANGVDTSRFLPRPDSGELRRALGVPPDAPIIGSIGRLEAVKGYDVMVEAFARLRGESAPGPAPVLLVAGDGTERARIERLASASGAGDAIRILGWRDDVDALHAAFTVFTLSSWSEGTSVSLLEAMSAGLCPVVTDVGGNAAVLGPGLAHRLVPPGDPAALAAAWRFALGDARRRQEDGAAARRQVEARFSIEAMVRGYERLYLQEGGEWGS